jgi:uncharacterized protein (DUF1499 family)
MASAGSWRTLLRLLPLLGPLLAAIAVLLLALMPDKAFALALATARGEGWRIVAADPAAGRIEATARSFWMGFADDIVVRVVAAGSGSRIDTCSALRYGRSDLGVNAARIRAYFAALRAQAKREEGEQ